MSALGTWLPGRARAVLSGMLLVWGATSVCAHTLPISYLRLVADTNYLHLELTLNPFELNFFPELDTNHNGRLEAAELEGKLELVASRILECLKLSVDGSSIHAEVAGLMPDVDSHHVTLRAHYAVAAANRAVTLVSTLPSITSGSHLTQVTFTCAGRRQLAQLDIQSPKVTFLPPAQARPKLSPSLPTKSPKDL